MKRIIWILTIVGLCLALVVSACAVPQVPEETEEFLAYTNMLEQAGVPEACEEAGIDFEETFVVPCKGEVPDSYTLLSLLFDSFGETDLWFAATALELYSEGLFTPDDLKALAVYQWKWTGEDEGSLEIFITENWKKEKIYHHSANIMAVEPWKMPKAQYPAAESELWDWRFPVYRPLPDTTPYPSSVATVLLATCNVHGGYSSILIKPATASNNVGETHTVVAEVWLWTADGVPICRLPGHMVDFSVTSSQSLSASITTDSEGEATFSYQGTKVGEDTITAITAIGGTQLTATATKIWEAAPELPPTPTLISPPDGSVDVDSDPHMEWSLSSGATSYHLQVATETVFIGPVLDLVIPTTSYHIPSGLSHDTSYYWRVEACNEYGCSSWSEVWSFQTSSPAPPL